MFWLCTLKSTIAFSSLLFFVWLTFLLLGIAYVGAANNGGVPDVGVTRAGGATGVCLIFPFPPSLVLYTTMY